MKMDTPTLEEWRGMNEEAREALRLRFAAASLEADIAEAERRRTAPAGNMTTREALIRQVAADAGLTRRQAAAALEAYAAAAISSVKSGGAVTLPGLGKVIATHGKAVAYGSRYGRKAKGAEAGSMVTFEPAKALRDALKG